MLHRAPCPVGRHPDDIAIQVDLVDLTGAVDQGVEAAAIGQFGGNAVAQRGSLRRIQKLPELVKSFFRQPECRYIKIWLYFPKN